MGRVWFSVHSQLTPLQIERHANVMQLRKTMWKWRGAETLLCYFKRGREDEERKDEENANTGDSHPYQN